MAKLHEKWEADEQQMKINALIADIEEGKKRIAEKKRKSEETTRKSEEKTRKYNEEKKQLFDKFAKRNIE